MKKLLSLLLAAALLLSLTIASGALADGEPEYSESVSGNCAVTKVFYVTALRPNASIDLNSYAGMAKIRKHATGGFTRDVETPRHGMYTVRQQGLGLDRSFLWIPDLSADASNENPYETVTLYFPSAGLYTVTVEPLVKAEADNYWYSDALVGWRYLSPWNVTNAFYCGFSASPDKSGRNNMQTDWWYTAKPVVVPTATPAPVMPNWNVGYQTAGIVTPLYWDTFFKPETCRTDNATGINRLNRLYDGSPYTCFNYLIWTSEWQNRYTQPQFYAFFNGASLSGIGLMNGNASSAEAYKENARVRTMKVVVHTMSGEETFEYDVDDRYSASYQYYTFRRVIPNVIQVDVHITGAYNDAVNRNNICISDICFFE